jgi:hypothetical protein
MTCVVVAQVSGGDEPRNEESQANNHSPAVEPCGRGLDVEVLSDVELVAIAAAEAAQAAAEVKKLLTTTTSFATAAPASFPSQ